MHAAESLGEDGAFFREELGKNGKKGDFYFGLG